MTHLFYSDKNVSTLFNTVNQELEKVWLWLSANNYLFLKSKWKNNPKDMSIKSNGLHIEQVTYTNFLGLYIDYEITRKYHINQVSSKIAKMSGIDYYKYVPVKQYN